MPMSVKNNLQQLLDRRHDTKNYKPGAVALAALEISKQRMGRILSNYKQPSLAELVSICDYYGFAISEAIKREKQKPAQRAKTNTHKQRVKELTHKLKVI